MDQGIKQVEASKASKPQENKQFTKSVGGTFPKEMTNWNELYEIKKWEEKIKREDLEYEIKKIIWFSAIWNIRSFGESIYTQKPSTVKAEEDQSNISKNILKEKW